MIVWEYKSGQEHCNPAHGTPTTEGDEQLQGTASHMHKQIETRELVRQQSPLHN